jgi:hypothetical protein
MRSRAAAPFTGMMMLGAAAAYRAEVTARAFQASRRKLRGGGE